MVTVGDRMAFSVRFNEVLSENGFPDQGKGRQKAVARAFGVSQPAARKWMIGEAIPGHPKIKEIASRFKIRSEWLEYGEGPKYPSTSHSTEVDEGLLAIASKESAPANYPKAFRPILTAYNEGGEAKKRALEMMAALPEEEMAALLLVLQSISAKYRKDSGSDTAAG